MIAEKIYEKIKEEFDNIHIIEQEICNNLFKIDYYKKIKIKNSYLSSKCDVMIENLEEQNMMYKKILDLSNENIKRWIK